MSREAEFRSALATGERSLGSLVYWRGLSDVHVDRDAFRTGFRAAGLGAAIGRDPLPEKLLNLAAMASGRRQARGVAADSQVRLKGKGTHAVYAVLMRRDGGDRLGYVEEASVAVDREHGGHLSVVTHADAPADDDREELLDRIVLEYEDLRQNVHTQEFSEALTSAMSVLEALTLRSGVYFVPASNEKPLRLLREFVEQSTRATVTAWEIRSSSENVATARRDAQVAMRERVDALIAEVREFVSANTPDDASTKSVNAAARKFRELDGKVQLYADILGDYQQALRDAIADAKNNLLGAFLGDVADAA